MRKLLLHEYLVYVLLLFIACDSKKSATPSTQKASQKKSGFDFSQKYAPVCLSVDDKPVFTLGQPLNEVANGLKFEKGSYQPEDGMETIYYFDNQIFSFRYPDETGDLVSGSFSFSTDEKNRIISLEGGFTIHRHDLQNDDLKAITANIYNRFFPCFSGKEDELIKNKKAVIVNETMEESQLIHYNEKTGYHSINYQVELQK